MIRAAILSSVLLASTGCVTSVTWRWATQTKKTSDRIHADIRALRREAGKPDLLVFELSHVAGIEDGLYALEIPAAWRSSPVWNRPGNYSHLHWLETPIDLEVKPVAEWTDELPAGADLDPWIEAHRQNPRRGPYYFAPYGPTPSLLGRLGPGKVVILQEFDWPVREELAKPGRRIVAGVFTPLTAAFDLLPVLLLVLLFRAWRRREPVGVAVTDQIACGLHLVGFFVTAFFIGGTGDSWALGWHVWSEFLGMGGQGFTVPWLMAVRILALVAAAVLCLVYVKADRGGVRRLRVALACSSLALLAIPFGFGLPQGPEVASLQGAGLLSSGAATVLVIQAILRGVRPLWIVLATFVPVVSMFLLKIYWGLLTALSLLVPPG